MEGEELRRLLLDFVGIVPSLLMATIHPMTSCSQKGNEST
jgi:hypothetical protein